MEIPEDEIVPEPEDVHAELERLEATRRWQALERQRRREREDAAEEWSDRVGGSS
jgi:hypothetical protein